jgi:hypothetical protein
VHSSARVFWGVTLVCALFGMPAAAGSVHIQWGPNAPAEYASQDVVLYEQLVAFRDSDPTLFDEQHPFFGELLSNPSVMEQTVQRWEVDEQRFEYWHPYLWQILNGYTKQPQEISPAPPGQGGGGETGSGPGTGAQGIGPGGGSAGSSSGGGSTGGGGTGHGGVGPSAGGGGGGPAGVPEPSSGFLLLTGLGALSLALSSRRASADQSHQ